MKVKVFKNSTTDILRECLLPILILLIVAIIIIMGLRQTDISGRAEGRRLLEDGITYAIVRNYAIEGYYPPSIAYIEERYGIIIDRERYVVLYKVFASNMIPKIRVVEL